LLEGISEKIVKESLKNIRTTEGKRERKGKI
jgi:hypothetical protein